MSAVALNSVVSETIARGESKDYEIEIPVAGKYVVEMGGTADVLFGVWEGDYVPSQGKLKVCGVARRGTRMLNAGHHVMRLTGNSIGTVTFKVRKWNFGDYFTIGFYKSTC